MIVGDSTVKIKLFDGRCEVDKRILRMDGHWMTLSRLEFGRFYLTSCRMETKFITVTKNRLITLSHNRPVGEVAHKADSPFVWQSTIYVIWKDINLKLKIVSHLYGVLKWCLFLIEHSIYIIVYFHFSYWSCLVIFMQQATMHFKRHTDESTV